MHVQLVEGDKSQDRKQANNKSVVERQHVVNELVVAYQLAENTLESLRLSALLEPGEWSHELMMFECREINLSEVQTVVAKSFPRQSLDDPSAFIVKNVQSEGRLIITYLRRLWRVLSLTENMKMDKAVFWSWAWRQNSESIFVDHFVSMSTSSICHQISFFSEAV